MGDFDRQEAPDNKKKKEQQKAMMAVVLAVVLGGVMYFHFFKSGPEAAMAASPEAAAGPTLPAESAEQVLEALRKNPLKGLGQASAGGRGFENVPRNPFSMSGAWRAKLQPAVVTQTPVHVETPTTQQVIHQPTPRVVQVLKEGDFKLASIVGGQRRYAVVNGKVVQAGAVVNNAVVVSIGEESVVLRHVESPEGPTIELSLKPKLNN